MEAKQLGKQCQQVLDYMIENGSISAAEAIYHLQIMRLASRIHDLKDSGYKISRTIRYYENENGERKHYAIYSLENG